MPQPRTKVFISYSHRDRQWFERLRVHLAPLVRNSTIDLWDDTRIKAGDTWHPEIARALAEAKIAVLLISADFLASEYIATHELPRLLEAARDDGAVILPVIISASAYPRNPRLSQFQAVNDLNEPLNGVTPSKQESVFESVAERVEQVVGQQELRAHVDDMRGQLDHQQQQLRAQQKLINDLVTYMVSAPIFRHLCGIGFLKEYKFWDGPMSRELYFLRDIGFIRPKFGDFAPFDFSVNGTNLPDLLEPTPIGWSCIRLRGADVPPEWLHEPSMRPNLRQDVVANLGL